MSTQYEFMKRQVVEEVAALQEKLIAIQADCINRIKEIPVTSGHFSWRGENGFRDIFSVEQWLRDNPEFSIYDEYGTAITWEQFKEAVAWCNG